MIISASRRTDLPACYSNWLVKRFQEGFVLVRNPFRFHQISRISLSPEVVDGIVFWTKNPLPLIPKLNYFQEYAYYFQFTLNSYDRSLEPGIPPKKEILISAFKALSDQIGPDRVIWRYDPILISESYSIAYHLENFERIAHELSGYTHKCIISFLDFYRDTEKNLAAFRLQPFSDENQRLLAKNLGEIAISNHLELCACAEKMDLSAFQIQPSRCIDSLLLGKLAGYPLSVEKDKNQRKECGCAASIDIGTYNTCRIGCRYCYAVHSGRMRSLGGQTHQPDAPLLLGEVSAQDIIMDRKVGSCRIEDSIINDG